MTAIIAITDAGKSIAKRLKNGLSTEVKLYFPTKGTLKELVGKVFNKDKFEGVVFIMALGIVVRLIAPHLKNKYLDPAVVTIDEKGGFAISVASGHEGGANNLAIELGNILNAEPVITTGSQVNKELIIGIGCRRGITKDEIIKGINHAVRKVGSTLNNVKYVSTIDLKKEEFGLKKACSILDIPLRIIPSDMVREFRGSYKRSSFVKKKIGIEGVSEPCALLTARRARLILPKIKLGRMTVAIARES